MNKEKENLVLAKNFHASGKIIDAQNLYKKLLKKDNKNYELFFLLGTTFLQQKKFNEAIENFDIAIKLNPNFPNSYNNKGIALSEKKNDKEAILNYDKAIKLKENYFDAYLNKGISLNRTEKFFDAINNFSFLLRVDPLNSKVYNNLGNVYKNLRKYDEALNSYDKALKLNKNFLEALINKADVLTSIKNYEESLVILNKASSLSPDIDALNEKILSNKMQICEWSNYEKILNIIKNKISKKNFFVSPLFVYYLFDEPIINKLNIENYISKKHINENKYIKKNIKEKRKIKIGYFSGDFRNHPVIHTMYDVFKKHNSSVFEIYAFSHGPKILNDIYEKEIKQYFKNYFIINKMKDEEVFELAKKINLDIAVDLTGATINSRTEIFLKRVAPIQINYLGFPGTSGIKNMDYIISDKVVIPENQRKNYTEEVIYIPKCFIPCSNNLLLKKDRKKFLRSEFKLPEKKIIFCAFHNPFKINPELFDAWMNILKKVENSVLWIKSSNVTMEKNLRSIAKNYLIDINRIIFTGNLADVNDHISRLELADIFLDAYPYNSHSSTYDCIRAKLPMVLWEGNTFSSRVASSIYSSINLYELIGKNKIEYQNIAITLAQDKEKLIKMRQKLINNSVQLRLFNNDDFTKNLENIYQEIFEKKYKS